MKTKKYIIKLTSFITAVCMICTLSAPTYAAFYDPAEAYASYTVGTGTSAKSESAVSESENDTGSDEISDDESTVTAAQSTESTAAGSESSKTVSAAKTVASSNKKSNVEYPAEEVTVFSYKTSVEVGEVFKIGYRLKPSKSDDFVYYSTSNDSIASVDSDGNVTPNKPGSAIITVKASSGVKDRFTVTVKESSVTASEDEELSDDDDSDQNSEKDTNVRATAIELKHSAVTISKGETYQIKYELYPSASTDTVKFRSTNMAVASVDENGVVTAMGAGETRIVCTASSGVYTKLNLTVLPSMTAEEQIQEEQKLEEEAEKEFNDEGLPVPADIYFSDESASVQIGESISLEARVYPAGSTYTYEITSSNESVATVTHGGKVTGVGAGSAVITITTDNGKSDSIYVTVYGNVIQGIDVSKWNGDIDWKTVKRTGQAQFAMIRASYGYEDTDPKLAQNVKGCEENDIPYGFYHYTYAKNVAEAKREAAYFLNVISSYSPEYPVVLDIEEDFYKQMDKETVTAIIVTFMEELENAGYYAMVYSYAKFINEYVIYDSIKDYDIWVACWGDEQKLAETYSYPYGMWQYTETGRLNGITEDVDFDYSYKDYRSIIKKYGLNRPTV